MGNTERSYRNYQEYLLYGKKNALGEVHRLVEAVGIDSISFGPTYLITTSKGEDLQLLTLYAIGSFHNDRIDVVEKKLVILACDEDGEVVGLRNAGIKYLGENEAEVVGDITTFRRESGISIPIEFAYFDLLQREADISGRSVVVQVENGSLERLTDLKDQREKRDDDNYEALIQQIDAEQERWQTLYGPNGLLTFDEEGTRSFSRSWEDLYAMDLRQIKTVSLVRSNGTTSLGNPYTTFSCGSIEFVENAEMDSLQLSKREYFNEAILQQLL